MMGRNKDNGVTSIVSNFGSNRTLAPLVGRELDGCDWVGIPFAGGMSELRYINARTLNVNDLHCHLVILCREHHDAIQSQPAALKAVLRAKWRHDREHTDWRRLLLLYGRWWDVDSLD